MTAQRLSLAIAGSGGSGAITTGDVLLAAAGRQGFYGQLSRSVGPQIRGGESVAMLILSDYPSFYPTERFALLLALDWHGFERFLDELPLDAHSTVLSDPRTGSVPEAVLNTGATLIEAPLMDLAATITGGRSNMVGAGLIARQLGIDYDAVQQAVAQHLTAKGAKVVDAALQCLQTGWDALTPPKAPRLAHWQAERGIRWSITGNEACGLGALRAGVRFVAGYPITPASDLLEWLAAHLEGLGGTLIQAEDELAAINMTIGASFGGTPALTATSGPGLSLMVEGIGLAIASETPITLIDVTRGGPSTGIPTKSEQTDLNLALYGAHGDAPRLVLAPFDIQDAVFTTHWAVCLAEQLQSVAIVVSDQQLGQSKVVIDPVSAQTLPCTRRVAERCDPGAYQRYALTPDGVSPMSLPGTEGCMYTADGLEHDSSALPSSRAQDHAAQLKKRLLKLLRYDYGDAWSEIIGSGDLVLVTWGSCSAAVKEAAERLRQQGQATRYLGLRLLAPLRVEACRAAIGAAQRVLVIEQNAGAQAYHYLRGQGALPEFSESYARPGPSPIRAADLLAYLTQESSHDDQTQSKGV